MQYSHSGPLPSREDLLVFTPADRSDEPERPSETTVFPTVESTAQKTMWMSVGGEPTVSLEAIQ